MKKFTLLMLVFITSSSIVSAQNWSDLSAEQKLMKAKDFREQSQQYLKGLGLNQEQLDDMDNVNICYLSTLDRIDRYGKDDAAKKQYAKAATKSRATQMDAIMGPDNRAKYQQYLADKIKNSPLAAQLQ
jgi:hypothetical protein